MSATDPTVPDPDAGLLFPDRAAFRAWLAGADRAAWLVLGKPGGPTTVSAAEALEEALCHGWIDGRMQRVDDLTYRKYFAPRRPGSVWSARNRASAERLIAAGRMTPARVAAVEAARAAGTWDPPEPPAPTADRIGQVDALVRGHEPAYTNWQRMPLSVRRTYTGFYFDAKTEDGRARRLERIIDRLDRNLKPM